MTGAKMIQLTEYAADDSPLGYSVLSGETGKELHDGVSGCVAADIRRERLQLYATHLELMLLRKNSEISELHRIMESRVEEMKQKQSEHERVMIHQARHAAMGEMLGTIAHQWRQPLNSISLVFQNLKDAWEYGEFDGDLLDRSLVKVMEQIMGLSRTIDDFRSFLTPVNLSESFYPVRCIEESVGLLAGWFSNFPMIDIQMSDHTVEKTPITGCPTAFTQVVFNLLTNAAEAVQARQRLVGPVFKGIVSIHFQRNDSDVIIRFADNGGGIAEDAMEHIFKPYFTTKPKANGMGTGLYVSKLIIENSMNGCLWAENTGDGALLCIRLPVTAADGGGI